MAKGGSSGGGTQIIEQRSNPEPPAIQRPYLEDIYKQAQQAYQATSKTPYGGSLLAQPTSQQMSALGSQQAIGEELQAGGFGQNLLTLGNDIVSGAYLHPDSNPYLAASMQAALKPVEESYFERVLPGLATSATFSGAYGGTADQALRQASGRDFAREALDATNRVANQNYQNERNIQLQAPQFLNAAAQSYLLPSNIIGSTGETLQGYNQATLDEAYQKYNLEQLAPWLGLPEYANILGTGNFSGGTSTQTGTSLNTGGSQFGNALQGAFGGAQMGGGLASLAGATGLSGFAPWLAGGAALGGLFGLF